MTIRSLLTHQSRFARRLSFLLAALLLLPSASVLAHPQQRASHAQSTKPQDKSIAQLKVGDIIPVRSIHTGKVELKRVTFAGKHTYPFLLSVQTISKGEAQVLTCPPDQQFKLSSGRMVPAARLAIGNSIVTRAGPATVRAMAQLHKPGGFVVCDVRVGPAPTARRPLFRTAPSLPVQFADYHQPRVSRTASDMLLAQSVAGGTPNSFLFAGQQYDQNLGLYYLRARYYAPTLGRFLSQDPYAGLDADPTSLHRYLYAGNDPVNYVDPSGQDGELAGSLTAIGGIATIGAAENPALLNGIAQATTAATGELTVLEAEVAPVLEAATPETETVATTTIESEAPTLTGEGTSVEGEFQQANESMSSQSAEYQEAVTGTPRGMVYTLRGVKFDGFRNGVLLDAKAKYEQFLLPGTTQWKSWFENSGAQNLVREAQRQIQAAGGRPIEWHCLEEPVARTIQQMFASNGITQIKVVFDPH